MAINAFLPLRGVLCRLLGFEFFFNGAHIL